jgi:hydroxymethylbilane synthase
LALEARRDDETTRRALKEISDLDAFRAVAAERAFLGELGAGCSIPGGATAEVDGETVTLRGVLLSRDGAKSVRGDVVGDDPSDVGVRLARLLRDDMGGGSLLGGES